MQTKTVTAGENACTVTLTGEEIMIKFSSGAPFFWVKNTGNSEFYAAVRPGANPGSDGVYPICAGEIQLLPAGCDSKIIYLSGTGSALVISSPIAACPFKKSVKGGDVITSGNSGYNLLQYEDGINYYWDYSQNFNSADNTWTDLISGKILSVNTPDSDGINLSSESGIGEEGHSALTVYTVCKSLVTTNDWKTIIGAYGTTPEFNLCVYNKSFAIGAGASTGMYSSGINATDDYHICAINFCNGYGQLYIDGVLKKSDDVYHYPIDSELVIGGEVNFKMIAFCFSAHRNEEIVANTKFLQNKYLT